MNLKYIANINDDNQLLKNVAKKRLSLSNRLFNKLKLSHNIFINDNVAFANDIVHNQDMITINFDYEEDDDIIPQEKQIEILYEDDWYIAVNKPAGIVVHPCSYHPDNTLANYVKFYLNNNKKIRPVNRLDKGTSGIVLFAKNEYAQERFNCLKSNDYMKEYLAIVCGFLNIKEGVINLPISRKEGSIIERTIDKENGQEAITEYKVIKEFLYNGLELSLVRVKLVTGRTHQIRVHFSYLGFPILGDSLYNPNPHKEIISRQALHAYKLDFIHPIMQEVLQKINIVAELEEDMNKVINVD